jgi:hypothetical protein
MGVWAITGASPTRKRMRAVFVVRRIDIQP